MYRIKEFLTNPFVWSVVIFITIDIGLIIFLYYLTDEFYKEIVQNIIVGISTALVMTITIGIAERKRFEQFQKDTAKNAIKSLFTRLVHRKTFEMIQKDIFQGKFVRKSVVWKYDITNNDNNNNKKMILRRIIQYTLKNITQKIQKEKFYIYSDNTNIHCKLTHTKISIKKNGQWENLSIKKDKEYRETKLKPNEELEVSLEMVEEFNEKLDYIYAVHSPRFGMVGLTLHVTFPENYKFEIVVDALSSKLEKIPGEIQGHCTYKTNKAIYKGQVIEFICYPKDKVSQNNLNKIHTNTTSKNDK